MEYTVSAADLANIRLKEEDEVREILRNVAVILATPMSLSFDPSNPGKLAFTVQIEIEAGDLT